ncbi:MAG TPA: hypothetical protein IAC28_05005 [Candidatus Aphodovivens excrementavium]|nr:hypothetical protein [Candidatus Aphodovivens excrementavium]
MKTCPICQAKAFDDAEVCYGCLHRFERKEELASACEEGKGQEHEASRAQAVQDRQSVAPRAEHAPKDASAPSPLSRAYPLDAKQDVLPNSNGWVMRVEFQGVYPTRQGAGAPSQPGEDDRIRGASRFVPRVVVTDEGFVVALESAGLAHEGTCALPAQRQLPPHRASRSVLRRRARRNAIVAGRSTSATG